MPACRKSFLPYPNKAVRHFCPRHAVVWKLHDKRNGFSWNKVPASASPSDSHEDTTEIQKNHHKGTVFREECGGKERVTEVLPNSFINEHRSSFSGHAPEGRCGFRHDARHGAQLKPTSIGTILRPERPIFRAAYPSQMPRAHIAAVFQNGQEEKQGDDDRKEA